MSRRYDRTLLFLGSQGYSGRLIKEALPGTIRTLAPKLLRDRPIAEQLLPFAEHLKRDDLVLNCLGPFKDTYRPVAEFCLEVGAHYLDINAEWQVFEELQQLNARAKEAGVMLLPGVGFDVLASDCLSAQVNSTLPDATHLQIGIAGLELISRGSARTMTSLVGEPLRVRRRGRIVSDARMVEANFDFGQGERPALGVSWGDISTAWHSTRIPTIEVFFEATPALSSVIFANRTFGWVARQPLIERAAEQFVARFPQGPQDMARSTRTATVVARAFDDSGRQAESRLHTREAYSFTADAACTTLNHFSGHDCPGGFQTPATALGGDFVLELPGCTRLDVQ